ncbi:hypothetical protein ACHMZP_33960 [Rhodococcus baikonurensis]|uniref:hypothetical protein n=1 Tax=Rhodococcus baikonurensis TaxID=172041 RepID=UPI00378D3BCC
MTGDDYGREAAMLAAYLGQFESAVEGDGENRESTVTGLTARERVVWRDDYAQASGWAAASDFSADDIIALTAMRRRYGFPSR